MIMKVNSIISRYLLKEMIPPFAVNLLFFTFVFLMTRILDITNLIVNYNIDLFSVLLLLVYSMPFFLEFIIPMSIMMAVLLSFLRLSSDKEILALKAGGVSIYGLLPPVLIFCFVGSIFTGFVAVYGLPYGRLAFKELVNKIAISNFDMGLQEKTFNESFEGLMLYVNRIDLKNKEFLDVFIEDQRTGNIGSSIVAPKANIYKDPDRFAYQLRLYNGTIHQVEPVTKTVHSATFNTYNINLDLQHNLSADTQGPKDEEEMSLVELREYLKKHAENKDPQYYLTLMEFHKKFSLPFACFALGLLAVPLGIQSRSSRRSFGVGLGLVFFLIYYLLLAIGWVFGETGVYQPLIGMWAPNIVMLATGLFLMVRTANERSFKSGFLANLTGPEHRASNKRAEHRASNIERPTSNENPEPRTQNPEP